MPSLSETSPNGKPTLSVSNNSLFVIRRKDHLSDELVLADELRSSAKRVEELATQVRQQLASNATLRQRLSETIERGEKDQKANAQKIMFMQSKLKSLEDQLMAAQQASEDKVARHEEEIRGPEREPQHATSTHEEWTPFATSFRTQIPNRANICQLRQGSENLVDFIWKGHDGVRGLQDGLPEAKSCGSGGRTC
jgi:chromosome segregation ATPase